MSKEMILKRLKIIQDLMEDLNKLKEVYEEALENDPLYQEVQEETSKVKEETKVKKEKVVNNPSYKAISEQIKEKREELKEVREILSQELIDYYRENGTLEIEDADGNVKKMRFSVRLVSSGL